jgi:hypothetical protein
MQSYDQKAVFPKNFTKKLKFFLKKEMAA